MGLDVSMISEVTNEVKNNNWVALLTCEIQGSETYAFEQINKYKSRNTSL